MPELPEVETVKRILNELVKDKTIQEVEILYPKIIQNRDKFEFRDLLVGQTIKEVKRRGKFLIIELTDFYLVSHLRMEGKYNYITDDEEITKHDHIIFKFTDGTSLRYNDVRKFGTMELIVKDELGELKSLKKLGPDGNLDFDNTKFSEKLQKQKGSIKEALLKQEIIAGIGNIYASEILFLSKINPEKKANELSEEEIEKVIFYTKDVLNKAIASGGTTIKSFAVSGDISGLFQYNLNVYGRAGEECPNCKSEIIKIKQGGRSTYYCPVCQENENDSN